MYFDIYDVPSLFNVIIFPFWVPSYLNSQPFSSVMCFLMSLLHITGKSTNPEDNEYVQSHIISDRNKTGNSWSRL